MIDFFNVVLQAIISWNYEAFDMLDNIAIVYEFSIVDLTLSILGILYIFKTFVIREDQE